MANNGSKRLLNLERLAANPDDVYELLDDLESDFEVESDNNDEFFAPPERVLSEDEESESSSSSSSSDEDAPRPSTSQKKSSAPTWVKQPFEGKEIPTMFDNHEPEPVLSPWGYFSRYFNDEFFEMGAALTSQYYLQQHGREITPKLTDEEIRQFFGMHAILWDVLSFLESTFTGVSNIDYLS
ncbi:uncharacterized protein LOC126749188 [Anthonomus grandis grandis]|uniref:uncharacterized protein LOC126749188 n=1 Tax=Anthonomus grandis grandis TaxID=2921223 RepID=UPI0021660E63|nr:uncharacterized protein LOC126749188 [Anthonomus grandis grandis]